MKVILNLKLMLPTTGLISLLQQKSPTSASGQSNEAHCKYKIGSEALHLAWMFFLAKG